MIYFDCDYMTGAHPEVLRRLVETNDDHTAGYGLDPYTEEARRRILDACRLPDGGVWLLTGGTQTNAVVIDRLLDRGDGVMATADSHINIHEAGAIEADGHKVIVLPSTDGKLSAESVRRYVTDFYRDDTYPHMVRPGMVYISFPTELGTLYSAAELEALHRVCSEFDIPLYIDGARLAYGLAASPDVTLPDIARLADVFYIGGTKCGALLGEAVVTRRPGLLPRFMTHIKRHGALLAKGRILGVQFATLFTDDLYHRIGRHGVDMALRLRDALLDKGYRLLIDSPTNQQFPILPNALLDALRRDVSFNLWGPRGATETPVRLVTDWSTPPAAVATLLTLL